MHPIYSREIHTLVMHMEENMEEQKGAALPCHSDLPPYALLFLVTAGTPVSAAIFQRLVQCIKNNLYIHGKVYIYIELW